MALWTADYGILYMLRYAPATRAPGGSGWRFGTRRIADSVADRLVRYGRARIDGDQLRIAEQLSDCQRLEGKR